MKKGLFVTAGLVVGFLAGAWTPLGELGAPDRIMALAMKSERISGLFGNRLTAGDRESAEQRFALAVRPLLETAASLPKSSVSVDERRAALLLLGQDLIGDNTAETPSGGLSASDVLAFNKIFADSPNAELNRVISALEAENQQIRLYLMGRSPSEPEFHLSQSIYVSNNQWLEALRLMVQKNNGAASIEQANALTPRLQAMRQELEESTYLGRQLIITTMQELMALAPATPEQQSLKNQLVTFVESYDASYDVEERLSEMVVEYPGLLARHLSGYNVGSEIDAWDAATLQLVTERMELKAWRRELAMNFESPTS